MQKLGLENDKTTGNKREQPHFFTLLVTRPIAGALKRSCLFCYSFRQSEKSKPSAGESDNNLLNKIRKGAGAYLPRKKE